MGAGSLTKGCMGLLAATIVPLVQRFLNARGLEIRRAAKEQGEITAAIDVLSLCVAELQSQRQDLFFVQIGAHDGLTYDPIRPFVEKHHWGGLLVEPQPPIFKQLVANYASEPQLRFENAALAESDGQATLYSFAPDSNLPAHASMLTSFRRELLEANGHGYSGKIQETRVPALHPTSLLKKHGVERVDFLQIDTEGYDYQILKMWDFAYTKPALIHFENNFLSAEDFERCTQLLAKQGYRLLTLGIDTIAYLQTGVAFEERAKTSALNAGARRL